MAVELVVDVCPRDTVTGCPALGDEVVRVEENIQDCNVKP